MPGRDFHPTVQVRLRAHSLRFRAVDQIGPDFRFHPGPRAASGARLICPVQPLARTPASWECCGSAKRSDRTTEGPPTLETHVTAGERDALIGRPSTAAMGRLFSGGEGVRMPNSRQYRDPGSADWMFAGCPKASTVFVVHASTGGASTSPGSINLNVRFASLRHVGI